jgi:hypothetical protein
MVNSLLGKAVFAVVLGLTFLVWWYKPWNYLLPATPPDVQVKVAEDRCAQMGGYDDGSDREERFFAAVAHRNLAQTLNTSTCDVFKGFKTLEAPGESARWLPWFREVWTVDILFADRTEAERAAYNQVGLDLKEYLTDSTERLKKYPWLTCITRQIRTTHKTMAPWPDFTLRQKMKLVHKTASGAEFFCPQ